MELVLNAFWLLLALASLGFWQRQRSHSKSGSRRRSESLRGLIALGCALAVLFPVISLTDDLHGEQAVMEDSSSSRKHFKTGGGHQASSNAGKLTVPPAIAVLPGLFSLCAIIVGQVAPAELALCKLAAARSFEGRAPPFLYN